MKLVSVKIDAKDRDGKASSDGPCLMDQRPSYPWGLQLNLDEETLQKLGLVALPRVGKTLMLAARVSVTSVSENESQDKDGDAETNRSVGLQITHLVLLPDSEKKDAAAAIYDGGDA